MSLRVTIAALAVLGAFTCRPSIAAPVSEAALALHHRIMVLDSHIDTPRLLERPGWNILERHTAAVDLSQVDWPRLREGGLNGAFWAIYTPQGSRDLQGRASAAQHGLAQLMRLNDLVERHPRQFGLALDSADARRLVAEGRHAVFISMENAEPVASDPALLDTYHRHGLRMLGLVHASNNAVADSATAAPEWHGLSPVGRQLVQRANCLGILLDASHASDDVFDQLLEISATPIVLSHSASRAITEHRRNLDDARLVKLAKKGGVMQVTLYSSYLSPLKDDPRRAALLQPLYAQIRQMAALQPAEFQALAGQIGEVERRYPKARASLDDFMKHLLHVLKLVGPAHVGIGADWDGGGGVEGVADVSELPRITERLMQAGYSESEIAAIWGGNLMQALDRAQAFPKSDAAGHCSAPQTR
ncbi:dipeptidase [Roseateles sp.]|uniref:dipeptidase n=1 Tax=Roseateles sp. TaxID=1971397 RepID=UPI0039EA06E1